MCLLLMQLVYQLLDKEALLLVSWRLLVLFLFILFFLSNFVSLASSIHTISPFPPGVYSLCFSVCVDRSSSKMKCELLTLSHAICYDIM